MWFVDVVVDLPWFVEKKGRLGKPRSRARQPIPGTDIENEFLLYGDEHAIRHLRVMLHTDADEPPPPLYDPQRWVSVLRPIFSRRAASRILRQVDWRGCD